MPAISKVYVLLVLMTTWLDGVKLSGKFDVIEYFAGVGRITRLACARKYKVAAFDLGYGAPISSGHRNKRKSKKKSCMDIKGSAGFVYLFCRQARSRTQSCIG